jgi:hypothetical protein
LGARDEESAVGGAVVAVFFKGLDTWLLGLSSVIPVDIAVSMASRRDDIAEDAARDKLFRAIFSDRALSADISA